MTEIEEVKAQIKVLEKKLEELEKTKSPVEEAYKRVYAEYPMGEPFWVVFKNGYEQAQEDYKVGEYQETAQERGERVHKDVERVVKESVKWCEEHPDWDLFDYLKPQTPEQTEKSLREAFVEAQKTEKWKEIQKLIDEEDNDKNFKNSLDLIKEWGEKNKPPTLYEILMEWWINHLDMEQSDEEIIGGLVDMIDKKFIPPSSERNTYEWEKCLKIMREKLR